MKRIYPIALGLLWLIVPASYAQDQPVLEGVNSLSDKVTVQNLRVSQNDERGFEISGEILNETSYQIYSVRVTAFQKDADGVILDSGVEWASGEAIIDLGFGAYDAIDPGKTGVFSIPVWSTYLHDFGVADIASYSLSITFDQQVELNIGRSFRRSRHYS